MSLARIRITTPGLARIFWAVILLPLCVLAPFGCGASASDVQAARNSGYDTEFVRIYDVALAEVRKQYPNLVEDVTSGVIKTAWHPVRLTTEGDLNQADQPIGNRALRPGVGNQGVAALNNPMTQAQIRRRQNRKIFFVRFTVAVVGGNPWRVRVDGQASEWAEGNVPSPLHGANVPAWLSGRVNSLRVRIHKKLKKYAVALPSTAVVDAKPPEPTEDVEIDQSHLGSLPPNALKAVVETLGAAKERDYKALRKVMANAFTWSLGAEPNAEQAIMIWQADSSILEAMSVILEAGCAVAESSDEARCPSQVADGYQGYRATFAKGKDGTWRMTAFVSGN